VDCRVYLHGYEIDERAAQLAAFAVMMQGRKYYRRLFRQEVRPNILQFQDVTFEEGELHSYLTKARLTLTENNINDLRLLANATNFGSLIQPVSQDLLSIKIEGKRTDIFLQQTQDKVVKGVDVLKILAKKYHCVVDNPPYMGGGNMNKTLADFVKRVYPDSKADLMATFMEAGLAATYERGFVGMINQHSWMFLSSYENLRKKLIEHIAIDNLLHLGPKYQEAFWLFGFQIWN